MIQFITAIGASHKTVTLNKNGIKFKQNHRKNGQKYGICKF